MDDKKKLKDIADRLPSIEEKDIVIPDGAKRIAWPKQFDQVATGVFVVDADFADAIGKSLTPCIHFTKPIGYCPLCLVNHLGIAETHYMGKTHKRGCSCPKEEKPNTAQKKPDLSVN